MQRVSSGRSRRLAVDINFLAHIVRVGERHIAASVAQTAEDRRERVGCMQRKEDGVAAFELALQTNFGYRDSLTVTSRL